MANMNDRADKIEFMQIDCDYYTDKVDNQMGMRLESKCDSAS